MNSPGVSEIILIGRKDISLEIEYIISGTKIGMKDFYIVGIPDKEGIYRNVPVIFITDTISLKYDLQKIIDLLLSAGLKITFLLRKVIYIEQIPKTSNSKVLIKKIIKHLINFKHPK